MFKLFSYSRLRDSMSWETPPITTVWSILLVLYLLMSLMAVIQPNGAPRIFVVPGSLWPEHPYIMIFILFAYFAGTIGLTIFGYGLENGKENERSLGKFYRITGEIISFALVFDFVCCLAILVLVNVFLVFANLLRLLFYVFPLYVTGNPPAKRERVNRESYEQKSKRIIGELDAITSEK